MPNLWYGESAYTPLKCMGLNRKLTPQSDLDLPAFGWVKPPIFNVSFRICYIILLIKTIHVKAITFI